MQTLVDMAERHSTGESHRLLLAAESVIEGFSVADWLEREGFDIITASDGQEALQIACSSWQPDVVLLDLELPGVDGFSVYKQIRAKNRRAVIFVLGDGSEEDEVRSLEAGADDYAAKRFSPRCCWPVCGRTCVAAGPPAASESYNLETSGWMRRTTPPG